MLTKLRNLANEIQLLLDYPLLGAMPADKQSSIKNGFSPTVASLTSATAEFIVGFSLLFMLLNGVFTGYFILSSSVFSVFVKIVLFGMVFEGLYRLFFIISGRGHAAGSVFYGFLALFAETVSDFLSWFNNKTPKFVKLTPEEKKQKEISENFKKFIEYGLDNPSLTWAKQ